MVPELISVYVNFKSNHFASICGLLGKKKFTKIVVIKKMKFFETSPNICLLRKLTAASIF